MNRVGIAGLVLITLAAWSHTASAHAYTSPGEPVGYVNDFAGILSTSEIEDLESRASSVLVDHGAEMVLVTVSTLQGESIEQYSNLLFREWGIGGAETNTGVLVVVALEERSVRIEVGYGLEGAIPDAKASALIRDYILPAFREGQYYAGLRDVVDGLSALIRGENLPPTSPVNDFIAEDWMWVLFFGYVVVSWLISIISRTKEWWLGGVFGFLSTGIIWYLVGETVALYAVLPLVLLGLSIDYVVSQGYRKAKESGMKPPWWTGGNWGGGGSGGFSGRSSGGFGGFGGGSSGGGGASGRW